MYSRLNPDLTKLGDATIVTKIILVLPHKKYECIIIVLCNMEDLSTMAMRLVISKLVAFEISQKMDQESTSSNKGVTLTCEEHKK